MHKAREQEFVVVQPLGLMPADVATFDQKLVFLLSGSSESPTLASAKSESSLDGLVGR